MAKTIMGISTKEHNNSYNSNKNMTEIDLVYWEAFQSYHFCSHSDSNEK